MELPDNGSVVARRPSNGCGIGAGGGVCLIFDDVPEDAMADVQIFNADFVGNDALIGG